MVLQKENNKKQSKTTKHSGKENYDWPLPFKPLANI